jgi:hypothetical protein
MFKPVEIDWKGKPIIIPASRLLGAIASVEEVITFNELLGFSRRGAYPAARIAQAYGALLRYAGEIVTDEDVYGGIFGDEANTVTVTGSMQLLLMLMVPPSLQNGKSAAPVLAPGEVAPGKSKGPGRSGLSKVSTRSSSRKTGARR